MALYELGWSLERSQGSADWSPTLCCGHTHLHSTSRLQNPWGWLRLWDKQFVKTEPKGHLSLLLMPWTTAYCKGCWQGGTLTGHPWTQGKNSGDSDIRRNRQGGQRDSRQHPHHQHAVWLLSFDGQTKFSFVAIRCPVTCGTPFRSGSWNPALWLSCQSAGRGSCCSISHPAPCQWAEEATEDGPRSATYADHDGVPGFSLAQLGIRNIFFPSSFIILGLYT